jgi:Ca2+:H+ antiporter
LLKAPPGVSEIARDTVFAAIMIVLNRIVGLRLVIDGVRHRRQAIQGQGAAAAPGVLSTLSVPPSFTRGAPDPVPRDGAHDRASGASAW